MPRSRAVLAAPIVLALVLIGAFVIRTRGNDDTVLKPSQTKNCAPVARDDAIATKPGEPISIDVLANDTDADGDPLVFQILKSSGGEGTVDDGGTPTDASDDRVLFTAEDPAPESAEISYQAVDPTGAVSEAVVAVSINAAGSLPAGVHSEAVTVGGSGRCGANAASSSTRPGETTLSSSPPYTGGLTVTTASHKSATHKSKSKKKKSSSSSSASHSSKRTTTTRKPSSSATTQHEPATTQPPHTTTTREPDPPPTTEPPSPGTTQPDKCGPFPGRDSPDYETWKQCQISQGGG
jgi:hypothetical protein